MGQSADPVMKPKPQFQVWATCLFCGATPPTSDDPPSGPWTHLDRWMAAHRAACVEKPTTIRLP